MTWTFSAEEWLVDFNSAPRGVARSGQALDPIDAQLRQLLPWVASEPQLVMPSIVPKRPKPEVAPPPPPASAAEDGLEIELRPAPATPPPPVQRQVAPPPPVSPAREENAPQPPASGELSVFIPTLTRGSGPVKAKDPVLEIGIPGDDDDDDTTELYDEPTSPIADDLFDDDDEIDEASEPEPQAAVSGVLEDTSGEIYDHETSASGEINDEPVVSGELGDGVVASGEILDEAEVLEDEEVLEDAEVFEEAEVIEDADEVIDAEDVLEDEAEELVEASPPSPPPAPPSPPSPRTPPPVRADAPPPPPRAAPEPAKPKAKPKSKKGKGKSKKKRPWYEEVFGEHYPFIMPRDSDAAAALDVAFIIESAKLETDNTVLDVGCGDGRHLFGFAKSGFSELTGLDMSLAQLAQGARKNLAEGAGLTFLYGDMRDLPTDTTYDVVTCLGGTLGYFDDDQNRDCVKEMVDRLEPGGKLIIQVMNRDHLMGIVPCRSWWQGRGCLVLDVAEMNFFANRVTVHRTIVFEDGRQFEHKIHVRAYTVNEIGKMVASHGLRVLEVSGSRATPGRFFGAASPDIWICAQRV